MFDTSKIIATTIIRRGKDISFSDLDDELLAIDAQAGYCYSLNETAGRVWALIATPTPVVAVCEQLCREFAVDQATCLRQMIFLVQGLYDAGLVQMVVAADASIPSATPPGASVSRPDGM